MQGPQDAHQPSSQPDKTGWIRKFCGKGIFREIWKNRFVVLKGAQLYISEKEVSSQDIVTYPFLNQKKAQFYSSLLLARFVLDLKLKQWRFSTAGFYLPLYCVAY